MVKKQEVLFTKDAPKPIATYVQGVKKGNYIEISGALGIDLETEKLAEGLENQTKLALGYISKLLEVAGASWNDVMKTRIQLSPKVSTDNDYKTVNEIYAEHFKDIEPPARVFTRSYELPLGALIEIDVNAVLE